MRNKAEEILMLLVIVLVTTACVAMRSKKQTTAEEYEAIPRTITLTPVTIEYFDAPRCHEDQPCWDCRTMGNKICGPSKKGTK